MTGDADVGELDDALADFQAVAFFEVLEVDAAGGEIFADVAVFHIHAGFAEALIEFFAVEADSAVGAAVEFAVFLPIAINAIDADHGLGNGRFGHSATGDVELGQNWAHIRHRAIMGRPEASVLWAGDLIHLYDVG